ncbi:MAG: hypothetical protein ACKVQB_03450 [Bacteroidia bacterium]
MVEKVQENEEPAKVRPIFLTVICILSFISCSWILFYGLSNMGEGVEDHLKQNALITTIGGIFSAIGTGLMWNTRQFGFGLFSAGTVFAIAGPIFIFGINHVLNFSTGYPAYFGLVLFILFALNYKHMD